MREQAPQVTCFGSGTPVVRPDCKSGSTGDFHRWRFWFWLFLAGALALAQSAHAATLRGKIVEVIDGDTIRVQRANTVKPVKVRLRYVDAAEMTQAFGGAARCFTLQYECSPCEVRNARYDRMYDRWVGDVMVEGLSLGELLLANGLAVIDPRYCPRKVRRALQPIQNSAKAAKRGMWGGTGPVVMPWVWRKRRAA